MDRGSLRFESVSRGRTMAFADSFRIAWASRACCSGCRIDGMRHAVLRWFETLPQVARRRRSRPVGR